MTRREPNEERPPAAGAPAPVLEAPARLSWSSPELAWPLSIAAGFAATFLGVKSGVPGAPALLAAAAFAPVFVRLQARHRVGVAFLSSVAWVVGIVAALVGVAVEGSGQDVFDTVPFARAFAASQWAPLDGAAPQGTVGSMLPHLAVFALVILVARPYLGVLALLLVAHLSDLLGAGAGRFAERMAGEGWSPSTAALVGSPPHLVLPLLGALAAACVVASPGRLRPLSSLRGVRRRLFWWGTAGGVAVVLLEPLVMPLWRGALG